jgi:hypothetical protein
MPSILLAAVRGPRIASDGRREIGLFIETYPLSGRSPLRPAPAFGVHSVAAPLGSGCVSNKQRPQAVVAKHAILSNGSSFALLSAHWPCHRAFDLVTEFLHRVSFHAQPQAVSSDSLWMGRYRYPGVASSAQHDCRIQSIELRPS